MSKIPDGETIWHRIGDVGYLDDQQRFWYCGRKSHRVETAEDTLFTERIEPRFMQHDLVERVALVGVGTRPAQVPVIVYELITDDPHIFIDAEDEDGNAASLVEVIAQVPEELTAIASQEISLRTIQHFLHHGPLPVDVRHNAKINREKLAKWAEKRLRKILRAAQTSVTEG